MYIQPDLQYGHIYGQLTVMENILCISMHLLIPTVMLTSWGAEVSAVIFQKNL
jgi:hypothetical protein